MKKVTGMNLEQTQTVALNQPTELNGSTTHSQINRRKNENFIITFVIYNV